MSIQDWRYQFGFSCRWLVGGVAQGESQLLVQDILAFVECFLYSFFYGFDSDFIRQRLFIDQEIEVGEVIVGLRFSREGVVEWVWVYYVISLRGLQVGTGTIDRIQFLGVGQDSGGRVGSGRVGQEGFYFRGVVQGQFCFIGRRRSIRGLGEFFFIFFMDGGRRGSQGVGDRDTADREKGDEKYQFY